MIKIVCKLKRFELLMHTRTYSDPRGGDPPIHWPIPEMGASSEKLLYEAIQRYDVDAVRHLIYHTGVDPNTNIRPFLHGKNLPETVLPLKEVLNKINSPPLSNGSAILIDKKYSLDQRLDMRQRGGTILKILLEKGAKVC